MRIFAKYQRNGSDNYTVYDGLNEATITTLLINLGATSIQFISSSEYNSAIPVPTIPLQPSELLTQERAEAVSLILTSSASFAKEVRAVLLTALDEINLLRGRDADRAIDVSASVSLADLKTRWAARATLLDRTVQQLKNSIQNKINAGDAD